MNTFQYTIFGSHTLPYLDTVIAFQREKSRLFVGIFQVVKVSQSVTQPFALRIGQCQFNCIAEYFSLRWNDFDKQPQVTVRISSFVSNIQKQVVDLGGIRYGHIIPEDGVLV